MAIGRKRISAYAPSVSGGGGGVGVGTAGVGPTYGPGTANDNGVTAVVRAALSLPALALSGLLRVRAAVSMPSLAIVENPQAVPAKLTGTALGAPFWQSVITDANSAASSGVICHYPPVVTAGSTGIGDLLIAIINTSNLVATGVALPTAAPGWTEVFPAVSFLGTVAALGLGVFYRIQDATDVLNSNFAFQNGGGTTAAQGMGEVHRVIGHRVSFLPTVAASPFGAAFNNAQTFDGVNRGKQSMGWDCGVNAKVTGNFCLEAKVKTGANVTTNYAVAGKYPDTGNAQPHIYLASNGKFTFCVTDSLNVFQQITGLTAAVANTTYSVAGTYDGTTLRLFVNGVLDGSALAVGIKAPDSTTRFMIGRFDNGNQTNDGGLPFLGTIEEVRLSNVSRYTTAYTPAAAPFTSDANTVGLWHLDTITGETTPDSGPNGYTGNSIKAPFDGTATTATLAQSALVTSPVGPTMTTTVVNTLIFAALNHYHATLSNTHTPPSGFDERTDFEATVTGVRDAAETFTKVFAATGATGTMTHTCTETVATDAITVTFAVAPGVVTLL